MKTLAALKHKNFIIVDGGYGFDQNALRGLWSKYLVDRSCGLAALANLVTYAEGRRSLERREALQVMDALIRLAPPRPWGIAAGWILARAVKRMNLPYRVEFLKPRATKEEIYDFVLRALAADRPVALLNTNHPHKAFRYHWVTITEMVEDEGEIYVRFSSWGRRYKMGFRELFPAGMMYRSMFYLME